MQLSAVRNAEYVSKQLGYGIPPDPEELRLPVIDEVETIRRKSFRGQVQGRREGDVTSLWIGDSRVVRHIMQGVEPGVNVLHQERQRQGRELAESCRPEIGRNLR